MDGLEAIVVVMGIEQRELLSAMDPVGVIVDIEHDARRHRIEAVTERINQRQSHTRQLTPRWQVLQPRQGWLAHQIGARLGVPSASHLEGRIEAQAIKVVAVLIAASDGEHPRPDHVGMTVPCAQGIAFVPQALRQQLGQAEAVLEFAQQQNAAVR